MMCDAELQAKFVKLQVKKKNKLVSEHCNFIFRGTGPE